MYGQSKRERNLATNPSRRDKTHPLLGPFSGTEGINLPLWPRIGGHLLTALDPPYRPLLTHSVTRKRCPKLAESFLWSV